MATITTDTFLDGGTARTAGEVWNMNGATLTIRTDTRWHANAPASMTGSLGGITLSSSLGGGLNIDAQNVRWMPYNSGSGTVPAIGTTITKGGVSGYLLGVWADYASAPVAVGASMPASGFLKFREVTGGTFSTGALTGIGASATEADRVGWIEVVMDQSADIITSYLGAGVIAKGGWFEIGTTTGSRGQSVQLPCNGGGSTTLVHGVQIETSPGSGVYDWYGAGAGAFTAAAIAQDARGKLVKYTNTGTFLIGYDGTANAGYLPPSGCKIRIPNIIMRQCTTGARATNATPQATATSRPELRTALGGNISFENIYSDWYLPITNTNSTLVKDSCIDAYIGISHPLSRPVVNNVLVSNSSGLSANTTFSNISTGIDITDLKVYRSGTTALTITNTSDIQCLRLSIVTATDPTQTNVSLSNVSNSTFTDTQIVSAGITLTSCTNTSFNNIDYISRMLGAVTASGTYYIISMSSCASILIDGVTVGLNGALSLTHPYAGFFTSTNELGPIKIRDIGTRTTPLDMGATSSIWPACVFASGVSNYIYCQRTYLSGTRSGVVFTNTGGSNFLSNSLVEDSYCGSNAQILTAAEDVIFRGIYSSNAGGTWNTSGNSGGTHALDYFTSDTDGVLKFALGQVTTTKSSPYVEVSVNTSITYAGITGTTLNLPTSGDYGIIEFPWKLFGHTAFKNQAAVFDTGNGTANLKIEYQIDTGSGWNGTWKTASGANLSGETISASDGFKLKIKVTCVTSNTVNTVSKISIGTVSTLSAQTSNLRPLDTVSLGFTNLVTGSEVRVYTGTDPATSVEIGGVEATSGSTFSFTHSNAGQTGYIAIFAMGYQPIYLPYTFKAVDDSILIQQVVDRNYVNPV